MSHTKIIIYPYGYREVHVRVHRQRDGHLALVTGEAGADRWEMREAGFPHQRDVGLGHRVRRAADVLRPVLISLIRSGFLLPVLKYRSRVLRSLLLYLLSLSPPTRDVQPAEADVRPRVRQGPHGHVRAAPEQEGVLRRGQEVQGRLAREGGGGPVRRGADGRLRVQQRHEGAPDGGEGHAPVKKRRTKTRATSTCLDVL